MPLILTLHLEITQRTQCPVIMKRGNNNVIKKPHVVIFIAQKKGNQLNKGNDPVLRTEGNGCVCVYVCVWRTAGGGGEE